jgi:acyl-coenzyme A thioesterase 9
MQESYAEAIIPLGSEPMLRNRYTNFQNSVRFGRLLEDLDTMAVHISYLHNKSQSIEKNGHMISPIVIVTALVDRIEVLNNKIDPTKNIKLSGFTSWVGNSSGEITMKMEQETSSNIWSPLLDAKFLVCARDTNNAGSALMNPLEVVTDEEKTLYQMGQSKLNYNLQLNCFLHHFPILAFR